MIKVPIKVDGKFFLLRLVREVQHWGTKTKFLFVTIRIIKYHVKFQLGLYAVGCCKKIKFVISASIFDIEVKNGHFLGTMGYDGFFPQEPLASMVFRWFCSPLTITINYFFNNWPLDSMVFQWFWGHSTIAI